MDNADLAIDTEIRLAALGYVRLLSDAHGLLTHSMLAGGFEFKGQRIILANRPRGIFKPAQMRLPLSLKTSIPRGSRTSRYADQIEARQQIFAGDESVRYSLMGDNPDAGVNQQLREIADRGLPLVYFVGVEPGLYVAKLPVFIQSWDAASSTAILVFGNPDEALIAPPATLIERRYNLRLVKQRHHQSAFRDAVIHAYAGRCALSGLPERMLLDAAHIIPDRDATDGQPIISNGIPLSKIHHAAFDAHLIGIDPKYNVHVSGRLREQHDGPMLEALKSLHGGKLILPRRHEDWPDPQRLERRFELFRTVA